MNQTPNCQTREPVRSGVFLRVSIFLALLLPLVFGISSCAESRRQATTLRFARWASVEESLRFQTLIDEFEKDNPDIRVETEYLPWDTYFAMLDLSLATGDAPDVFVIPNTKSAHYIIDLSLRPLGHLDTAGLLGQFSEPIKGPMIHEDKVYGIPIGLAIPVFFYNKRLLTEAGIPFPSPDKPMTWDKFYDLLARLKKVDATGEVTQYPLLITADDLAENLLNSHWSPLYTDAFRQRSTSLVPDRALTALNMLAKAYTDGLVPPPGRTDIESLFGTSSDGLRTGLVAFCYTGMWSLPLFAEADIDYGAMPVPRADVIAPKGTVNYLSMSPDTKKEAAAWRLITWFAMRGQDLIATSGDYPANMNYNPVEFEGDVAPDVYRTVASEKAKMVPAITVLNPQVDAVYRKMVTGVILKNASSTQALSEFIRDAAAAETRAGE